MEAVEAVMDVAVVLGAGPWRNMLLLTGVQVLLLRHPAVVDAAISAVWELASLMTGRGGGGGGGGGA